MRGNGSIVRVEVITVRLHCRCQYPWNKEVQILKSTVEEWPYVLGTVSGGEETTLL